MTRHLDTFLRSINRFFILIAGIFLIAMIGITCANIFFRTVWLPVRGTFELLGFFGAVVTSFSLGYTQMSRGHIAVDVLFRKFPGPVVRVLTGLNDLLCALFFSLVAWQVAEKAMILRQTEEVSETLRIAYYPFTWGVAAGCSFLTLVFLVELIWLLIPGKEKTS